MQKIPPHLETKGLAHPARLFCFSGSLLPALNCRPRFAREAKMANREQRNNREKKKPKQDKDNKKKGAPPASPFAQQAPVQFAKPNPQTVKK
jgi:hypothetical protein